MVKVLDHVCYRTIVLCNISKIQRQPLITVGSWVSPKLIHDEPAVDLSWKHPVLQLLSCRMKMRAFLHLTLIKNWSGQTQSTYNAECLKFIFMIDLCHGHFEFCELNSSCTTPKFQTVNVLLWGSRISLSLKFLVDHFCSSAYHCFHFCGAAHWLIAAWIHYLKTTWIIFTRKKSWTVLNWGEKSKTESKAMPALIHSPRIFCSVLYTYQSIRFYFLF